jgi:uncharacterized protein (TIGR02001 family)
MRPNNTIIIFYILAAILFGGAFTSWAEEESPSASGSVSFLSKYMWRGYELSGDNLVLQPSITLGYKGFAVNSWSNMDTDADNKTSWTETDLTLSYDKKVGPVGLGAGYIYYGLNEADDTKEFYLKASYDTILAPTLIMYRDIDAFPGYYFNLCLSHSFDVAEWMSLGLSGGVGYYISSTDKIVEAGTDDKYNGLQDGLLSATLNVPVGKYATVAPTISYAFALSNKAKILLKPADQEYSNNLFGGVVFSIAF